MTDSASPSYTTFDGFRRIAQGSLLENALAYKHALAAGAAGPVLLFEDATGRGRDVDIRGTDEQLAARVSALAASEARPAEARPGEDPNDATEAPAGRGRPKLGVVPREVTLLPRHWEWLATQPGGASVALRKLVEAARRESAESDRARQLRERAYHFMMAIAGNLHGYEEATRALFAGDRDRFAALVAEWPVDVRQHATRLAFAGGEDGSHS